MISEDIKQYVVRYPHISVYPDYQPDGNSPVYFASYLAIKRRFLTITLDDKYWFKDIYHDCLVEPGLTDRGSHKRGDRETHDNPLALAYASCVTGEFQACIDIYEYGKNHFWIYNNAKLKGLILRKTIHGRMPGFIQHLKLGVRKKLNLFDQIWWFLAVAFNSGESGLQLSFIMIDMYRIQPYTYWLCDKAVEMFENSVRKRYPNLMGDVYEIYFKKPAHPFARYMQGRL